MVKCPRAQFRTDVRHRMSLSSTICQPASSCHIQKLSSHRYEARLARLRFGKNFLVSCINKLSYSWLKQDHRIHTSDSRNTVFELELLHEDSLVIRLLQPLFSTSTWISVSVTSPCLVMPISLAKVVVGLHPAELRGVTSSSILSTCSSDKPLVSGTRK